ncbi:GL25659 [Drosophila persimilis]|uniref:GL25659 n=2 Tax=Drosophila persimilis TaxID=7234 RepID=B4GKM9_DROPE|nr:GL25659 [Drosophila persimilis]
MFPRRLVWVFLAVCFMCLFNLEYLANIFGKEPEVIFNRFLINTPGCRVRVLAHPKKPVPFVEPIHVMGCSRPQLISPLYEDDNNYLKASNIEEDLQCKCWRMERQDDRSNKYLQERQFNLSRNENEPIQVECGHQMYRIQCRNNENVVKYNDVIFFIPPPFEEEKTPRPYEKKRESLSVMILGIDSLSQMHFERNFPHLTSFLDYVPHTFFLGYSRVGLDAYENVVPLLSGLRSDELEQRCLSANKSTYDKCGLLWEKFKDAGYSTIYGEDTAKGIFTDERAGFRKQPTDFYLHPVMLEMDKHTRYSIDASELIHCSGGRQFFDVLNDFIDKLSFYMQTAPFFSFFWHSQGVKDYYHYARRLDVDYVKRLRRLLEMDILDNTLVLLMSDYGLRSGKYRLTYSGMREESQPFLVAIYPDWLKAKYPFAMDNFKQNAHNLVTAFDLHATLKDVMDLNLLKNQHVENRTDVLRGYPPKKVPRGVSLFLPLPLKRNCESAGIPSHYCPCTDLTEIPTDDGIVLRTARFLIASINQIIGPHEKCQQLRLYKVMLAYFVDLGESSFVYELRLRVSTIPGDGLFEGTARLTDTFHLTGPITRVNEYRSQSFCVNETSIKMYCYCPN